MFYSLDVHEDRIELEVGLQHINAFLPISGVDYIMAIERQSLSKDHPVYVIVLPEYSASLMLGTRRRRPTSTSSKRSFVLTSVSERLLRDVDDLGPERGREVGCALLDFRRTTAVGSPSGVNNFDPNSSSVLAVRFLAS